RGDVATFKATGTYLYGAPMLGATLRTTVTRAPVAFTPAGSDGFAFGDESAPYAPSGSLAAPVGDLDEQGALSSAIPLDLPRQMGPERVTVEAEVEDETKQTVAKTTSAIVHPAEFYLGLRRDGARFVTVKDASKLATLEVSPEVAAFESTGKHRAGVAVTIELVSRTWTSAVGEQADGSALSLSAPVEKVIATCTTTTTDKLASCALKVTEVGFYVVRARAKDPRGNETKATTNVYVLTETPTPSTQTFAQSDLKTLKIEPEKLTYKAGETAKILVHNPFAKAQALITIERAGVLERRVTTLEGPMPIIEVPITREYFPNVFVAVELVRGRIQAPPKSGLDLGGPDARVGVAELKIEPDSHRLKVAITPSKIALTPGEALTTDVAVTDSEGKPTEATLTFYAVDEGVLMLTGYKTPDPLPTFAERRRLGVFGFESREHLATIVPMRAGEKVPILGWDVASDGWSKGSSYGGGGEESGRPSARADFRATAFFEAGRVTSFDGRAHFEWKLPDNLTSYRLMAIAAARDDRFGFGQTNITASKALMIRPALPRQLRVGDDFEAAFVVTTKGLPASDVDVSIAPLAAGAPLSIDGPLSQRVHVAAGAQASVRFHVKATREGSTSFDVTAKTATSSDRILLERHVDQPRIDRVETAYGQGTAPASIAIGALDGRLPDHGGARVQLASSALVGLASGFEQLVDYPYGCTEQVASRTLPMLTMVELAKQAGARLPAKTDDFIADGIAKLLAHQQWSGGFGFWEDDAPIAWLSAYATLTLEEAAKHGHEVPKEARDRAVRYLRGALTADVVAGTRDDLPSGKSHDEDAPLALDPEVNKQRALAEAAMIADVLATIGAPDAGALEILFDSRAKLPLFAKSLLLHAMVASKLPAATNKLLVDEVTAALVVTDQTVSAQPEGPVYVPMLDSGTRTTAMALRALLAFDPKTPLASKLARGLLDARSRGAWASTQATVWSLMALDDYRRAQESVAAKIDAEVFLGDTSIFKAHLEGVQQASIESPASAFASGAAFTIDRHGEGALFWATELRWSTASMPTMPVDSGLFIDKRIRTVTPSELTIALESLPKARAPDPKALLETKVK
ncbi:MAG: alpha-2-macroglobulin, partial [Polyangiales bacterium]